MTSKKARIAALLEPCQGGGLDPRYLGFFHYFNRQRFYDAHEVLEDLWLPQRNSPDGDFYRGLIQLAGAFVHVQKCRFGPARALLSLAQSYLGRYPMVHKSLDVRKVLSLIIDWNNRLEASESTAILIQETAPQLSLSD